MPIEYKSRECDVCGTKTEWWLVEGSWSCVRCKTQ